MQHKILFLKAVLGEDGAQALEKAAELSKALENALVPRTILAWLGIAARNEHRGKLPGLENTYVEFRKSESGYSGQIAIGDDLYEFTNQTLYHVAASVAVSMGVDHERVPSNAHEKELASLGKSIDKIVKARVAYEHLVKVELPGQTAKPQEAAGPIPPDAPTMQPGQAPRPSAKPKLPRPSKKLSSLVLPKLKLNESQLSKTCNSCTTKHVNAAGKFIGCLCWRALAKTTSLAKNADGTVTVTFGANWDREAVAAFLSDMRVKK